MWYFVSLFNHILRSLWLVEVLFEHVYLRKICFFEVKTWLFLSLRFIVEILVFYQYFLQFVINRIIVIRTYVSYDYDRMNVFNVVCQQRIRIVFLFNSKLNYCVEWSKCAGRWQIKLILVQCHISIVQRGL